MTRKTYIILNIFIYLIVVGLAIGNVFIFTKYGGKEETSAEIVAVEETIDEGRKNCGDDFACLAERAKSCLPAYANNVTEATINGVKQKTYAYREVIPVREGKCDYYQKFTKFEFEFPASSTEESKNSITNYFDGMVDKEMTCRFDSKTLAEILTAWSNGFYSTEDMSQADYCTGEFYEEFIK